MEIRGYKRGEKEERNRSVQKIVERKKTEKRRERREKERREKRERGEKTCENLEARKETSDFGLGIKLEVKSW